MKATHAGPRTSPIRASAEALSAAASASPASKRRPGRLATALGALSVAAAALTLATTAAAQVNIESMRVGADEPGWSSTLDLNSAFQRGNRDRDTLGAGARFQYAWKQGGDGSSVADGAAPTARGGARARWRAARRQEEGQGAEAEALAPNNVVFLTSNYSFSELNDNRFINNATSHLRFIRQHSRRLSFEAFGQHQFNEFTRLEQRLLIGGGGRFLMIEEPNFELFLGAGYMLERETLDLPPQATEPSRSEHHRSTNYATLRFNSDDDRLRLVETVYLQTRFDRVDDYRVLSETSFEIQLLRKLALAVNLNIAHDSEPPFAVKSTDVVLSNSLRYTFQ